MQELTVGKAKWNRPASSDNNPAALVGKYGGRKNPCTRQRGSYCDNFVRLYFYDGFVERQKLGRWLLHLPCEECIVINESNTVGVILRHCLSITETRHRVNYQPTKETGALVVVYTLRHNTT